jgi:uncharacterized surface protein with fasciclin (FAS1) repeats
MRRSPSCRPARSRGLLNDPAKLKDILLYHVLSGKVLTADAAKLTTADTALGQALKISAMDGKVKINDANVVLADIETSKGVIYLIDTVLLPSN